MIDISREYMRILNNIDGFLVIDKEEKIVYMADNLIKQIHRKSLDDVIGMNIRDAIPTNKTYKILQTGEKQIGEMYFVEGYTIVSNGYPIYKDGEIIGAFEYDVFSDIGFIEEFLERTGEVGAMGHQPEYRHKVDNRKAKYSIDDIKGSSAAITRVKQQIIAAARSQSTVLITGETGCGKELVAHAIHKLSQRSLFHFVRLNCAAIPNELFESELFGYEEGSFTGAKKGGKFGMAEIANNGTLFFDEIDNLTLAMQAKMLRFLQEKEIYHVGGDFAIPVDTRIIAATNQKPEELISSNKMRRDLYYRLNVIEIDVPPLRERLEDIPEISESIIGKINEQRAPGIKIEQVDHEVYEYLMGYEWKGNIRELSNVIERASNNCEGTHLKLSHFDKLPGGNAAAPAYETMFAGKTGLKEIREEAESYAVRMAMMRNDNNITKAAEELGISRQMLHRKLNEMKERSKQKLTVWHRA